MKEDRSKGSVSHMVTRENKCLPGQVSPSPFYSTKNPAHRMLYPYSSFLSDLNQEMPSQTHPDVCFSNLLGSSQFNIGGSQTLPLENSRPGYSPLAG